MNDLVERLREHDKDPTGRPRLGIHEQAASRISAELERLRREVEEAKEDADEWRSIDRGNAETISELRIKLAEVRKAAFIEAAEIVEGHMLVDDDSSPYREKMIPRSNPGNQLGMAYATALRAKAEETGR